MNSSELCFTHNPDTKEAKQSAVIRGGKSPKKNYNPLPSIELIDNKGVVNLLVATINEVRAGEIDLRVANCIGFLSGHLLRALEISELEGRVETIERVILERKTSR